MTKSDMNCEKSLMRRITSSYESDAFLHLETCREIFGEGGVACRGPFYSRAKYLYCALLLVFFLNLGSCPNLLGARIVTDVVTNAEAYTVAASPNATSANYELGPEDSLLIHVKDEPEIPDGPYQIDLSGTLTIPEIGVVHASGMSVGALSAAITERCRRLLNKPVVSISVAEYRSQRVSVLGAVGIPGVQQIRGRKSLYEVISDAGGLKQNAGGSIQISRLVQEGPIPLPNARLDSTGQFETVEIDVDALMRARSPQANIAILPNDVVTVPKAELVYVLGAVRRPGGFELSEKQSMSVMQALALAEGAERTAATKHARILHKDGPNGAHTETSLDLNKLLAGKERDVMLQPNDILVVPNSAAKSASYRALEAAVNTGSGVAIYRPY
jgi:polysaccharide biosynthesis/export protein